MITKDSNGATLTTDYIAALTEDNRQYEAVLLDNGVALDCAITRMTVTKGSCGSEDGFTVGSVVGSTLTAEVKGLTTAVKGKELEARIGVEVGGAYTYVTLGYFTITEAPQTAYATTLTGYGKIITKTGDAFNDTRSRTASGTIATFTDGSGTPAESCRVSITPKQSGTGTPSPDNVRPISGWESVSLYDTGVNVWDEEWQSGAYSTTGSLVSSNIYISSKNKIAVKPSTEYYFYKSFTSPLYLCEYGQDESFLRRTYIVNFSGGKAFTTSADAYYINFSVGGASTPVATYGDNISINYPSTDHDYHAYNGTTTTPVNLGRTVYGGTLDVVSGVLTVDRAMVDLGDATWTLGGTGSNIYFSSGNSIIGVKKNLYRATYICSQYEAVAPVVTASLANNQICQTVNPESKFFVKDSRYTSASDFKSAMSGVQLVYELATPQTYTLTPQQIDTLLGVNNVWADSGDIEIVYTSTPTLANIAASVASSMTALAGKTVTVSFASGIDTSKAITASLANITVYNALEVLAGVCGGFATDTYDGNVKIYRFDDTPTLARDTATMRALPVVEEDDFSVTGVLCIVSEDSEDDEGAVVPGVHYPTTPTGNENLILQNPYATQALYTANLATLTGYTYRPATIGLTYGDPRLEGVDVVQTTDVNGNVYVVPCHILTHTFDGGFTTQITAANATPQENETSSAGGSLTEQLSSISANAISARTSAESAKASAAEASQILSEMNDAAEAAGTTLTQIYSDAEEAKASAEAAASQADAATDAAQTAASAANGAITQLGTIENVLGTLNWIAEHGTYELTTDTQVVNGKLYFAKVGDEYVAQTLAEDADPQALGLYELAAIDEAVTNYISSHLALTGEGLSIVKDDQSGRALFSPDGVTIYNATGEAVAQYGEKTVLGDPNGIHIEITGEQLGFYEGSSALTDPVAYISNQQLYIPRAVVVDSMQVGDSSLGAWQWAISPTSRNLRLVWIGE